MSKTGPGQESGTFRMFGHEMTIDSLPKTVSEVTQVYAEDNVRIGLCFRNSVKGNHIINTVRHYIEVADPRVYDMLAVAYSYFDDDGSPFNKWPFRVENDDCVSKVMTEGRPADIVVRVSFLKTFMWAPVSATVALETVCGALWSKNEFSVVCEALYDMLGKPTYLEKRRKEVYRGRSDFFVTDTDTLTKRIRWGGWEIYVPLDKSHANLLPAIVASLGEMPSEKYLKKCITAAEKKKIDAHMHTR